MPNFAGLTLSELLSEHHQRTQREPNFSTVTPQPGMPGGPGPVDPHKPHNLIAPDVKSGLLDFLPDDTTDALGPVLWNLEEHLRNVSERVGKWPVCDWHAIDRVILSNTVNVDGYQLKGNPVFVAGRAPTRRLTIWNPTGLAVDVTDAPGSGSLLTVPAGMAVVMPWNADSVLVSTAGTIIADSTVLLVRSDRETDEIRAFPIVPAGSFLNESTGLLEAPRTMSGLGHFVATAASGSLAVWTPTLRFRLLKFTIDITNDAATAGGAEVVIDIRDGTQAANAIGKWTVFVPAAGGTTLGVTKIADVTLPGNGYLSQQANATPLDVNLSVALSAGVVRVNAWGSEE